MKKKPIIQQTCKLVTICYDKQVHGWVIEGKHKPVFASQVDLQNYCRNKLGLVPVTKPSKSRRPVRMYFQQLPHCSVWTGAPWDRTFSK